MLMYPHPGYLFHAHTVLGALFVVVLVFSETWAKIAVREGFGGVYAKYMRWHKYGMLTISCLSALASVLMLYKPDRCLLQEPPCRNGGEVAGN